MSDKSSDIVVTLSDAKSDRRRRRGRRDPNQPTQLEIDRAINARPWKPLPGMRKYRCIECEFFFASRQAADTCLDCQSKVRRRFEREAERERQAAAPP